MKSKKAMVLSVVFCLLPTLAGILLWDALPARIATHFDINGVADGWSNKGYAVFFLPAMMAALDALCLWGMGRDKSAHRQSKELQKFFLFFIPVLSSYMMTLVYLKALGKEVRMDLWLSFLMGLVFLIVGNYLPKCRRNRTMGIRVKWTLASEENWNYTHRIGGFCWVLCGFATLIGGIAGRAWLLFPCIMAAAFVPILVSYVYYLKNEKE